MGALNTHDLYLSLGGGEKTWKEVIQAKHLAIKPILEAKGRLMPGATKLRDALHAARIPAAPATSARRKSMEIILTHFSLTHHFAATVALEDVPVGKPDPSGYLELAQLLGVRAQEMVYVGNEPKDAEGARNACMTSVFVDRHNTGEACGADLRISSLDELISLLSAEAV